MKKLSLICTVHEECGRATSVELFDRLKRYRPDVIFLEAPLGDVDSFFREEGRPKLETSPVKKYQNLTGADLIAVDLPTPSEEFFRDHKVLMQRVEGESYDHRRLMTWQSNYVADYGFPYLNSDHNCKMWLEIKADIENTVVNIGDPSLSELLSNWDTTNDHRENEMLYNIHQYCTEHSFERGVFIVGSAHRRSIIQKLQLISGFRWNFSDI